MSRDKGIGAAEQKAGKEQKREMHALRQLGQNYEQIGDYKSARQCYARLLALGPTTDDGMFAAQKIKSMGVDVHYLYVGLATLALYGLAWLYAFAEHSSL